MTVQSSASRISKILKILEKLLKERRGTFSDLTVDLQFLSATEMSRINRQFRKKNKPTDVLSFEVPAVFREQGVLGSIAICLPVMKAQAKTYGHSLAIELDVLLVHGVLHLFGLDHEKSKKEAALMIQMESLVLGKLGGPRWVKAGLVGRTVEIKTKKG